MGNDESPAHSRKVSSNQRHTHPQLPAVVQRHLAGDWQKPVADYNLRALDEITSRLQDAPRPIVLDSFCGTGHSTFTLSELHPQHLIIGIDKSAHRLARHPYAATANTLLVQAECEVIWRLLAAHRLFPDYHYLFYPNPWPKKAQLSRRIHGHPAFPFLLELGGHVELRSNWPLYVEEFGLAMLLAGVRGRVQRITPSQPITLFEKKYANSGHDLWQYRGFIDRSQSDEVLAIR